MYNYIYCTLHIVERKRRIMLLYSFSN